MIVLIDNGHGSDTPGKCSPDQKLKEYLKSREIARRLETLLNLRMVDARLLVEEDKDISLPERCRRANAYCDKYGKENVLLVSIHCNAAGADGQWKSAGGWGVFTPPGKTKGGDLGPAIMKGGAERLQNSTRLSLISI